MAAAPEQIKKRPSTQEPETPYQTFVEESAAAGRQYMAAANAEALRGLKVAFALQNEGLKAGRQVLDATVAAGKTVTDAWTEAVGEGQAVATRLTTAGAKLIETTLEPK
jgi:hypothetical protein